MDYSVIKVTPDPVFSVTDYNPPKAPPSGWLYARGEYEAFVLAKMRENVKKLKLYVGYPGQFRPPYTTVFYRHALPCGTYETCGTITDMSTSGAKLLKITAPDIAQALPALKSAEDGWEVSVDGISFTAAQPGGVPTGDELPRFRLPLAEIEPGLYDTGREVLADITFRSAEKPSFNAGESIHEALHVTPEKYVQEQTFELEEIAPGVWKTPLPLAFRYIKLKSAAPDAIEIDAAYTPLVYRRTYDFGDEELNRIWACSAYTLRLCIHTFQIDGVKRDRLPWGGDLAISLLANAYSFREPEPIKRTLTVLGRDGTTLSQVNGILDYSLWIVISHECYQRHFDDPAFLDENYPAITQIIDSFIEKADADGGLIRPAEKDWCFIDWLEIEKTTSLQMLFHWALVSAASLAARQANYRSGIRKSNWNAYVRLYSSLEPSRLPALERAFAETFATNSATYLQRLRDGVVHVVRIRDEVLPGAAIVMGEGGAYCPANALLAEERCDGVWRMLREQSEVLRRAGLWGAVARTPSGPEDPSWNLRADDYRRINETFRH